VKVHLFQINALFFTPPPHLKKLLEMPGGVLWQCLAAYDTRSPVMGTVLQTVESMYATSASLRPQNNTGPIILVSLIRYHI
jgi:hypothetical protein